MQGKTVSILGPEKHPRRATHLLVLGHDVGEEVSIDLRVVPALLKGHAVHLAGLNVGRLVRGIDLGNHPQLAASCFSAFCYALRT